MGIWGLGSVADAVYDLVPDIPDSISGTRMREIADEKREFIESRTGLTIGSNSIGIEYQSIIKNFTISEVASLMSLQGADASNIRLGDFSIKKGAGGNLSTVSKTFEEKGMKELKELGRGTRFYKAFG